MEFSVLATATDAESGISSIKLLVTRTVCFRTSAGNVSQAYFGTKERKSATYQAGSAPTQASLGDTGIFDNTSFGTDPANLAETNLLLRRIQQRARRRLRRRLDEMEHGDQEFRWSDHLFGSHFC